MKLETVFAKITKEKVMLNLLKDITTPSEFKALQERLDIAILLGEKVSYSKIAKKVDCSTTTIVRVAKFLHKEENGGYEYVIKNLSRFKNNKKYVKNSITKK